MVLFGQTAQGIHIGLLIINCISIVLIYLLTSRLIGTITGAVASAVFAVLTINMRMLGLFAHATHFVTLFWLAGFLSLFCSIKRNSFVNVVIAGACFGIAITMKQHAIVMLPFALTYFILSRYKSGVSPQSILSDSLIFSCAAIIPYIIIVAYHYSNNTLLEFWFWTVQYASAYTNEMSLREGFDNLKLESFSIGKSIWPILILASIGFLRLVIESNRSLFLFITMISFASFMAICPGFYFRQHYFIMLIPSVALLAGIGVQLTSNETKTNYIGIPYLYLHIAAAIFFLASTSYPIMFQRNLLFIDTPEIVSRSLYHDNPFQDSVRIAAFIKANSDAHDKIAILGSEPQILFYANRKSATRHIYMYGLMESHSFARSMQEDLAREIEASYPTFIVYCDIYKSWLVLPQSEHFLFEWMNRYLADHYDLVGVARIISPEYTDYYWGEQATNIAPHNGPQLLIFRNRSRKDGLDVR